MRDDFDYATADGIAIRQRLVEVSKNLAAWSFALGKAKAERNQGYLEAYSSSPGKSVAERRMDAEMATAMDQGMVLEYEGNVGFYTAIRDMIVVLIAQVEVEG